MGSTANEAGDSPELEAPNFGVPINKASTETPLVPEQLKLTADRQFYDSKRKITIAEGNVTARLGEAQIQADRIEFDTGFRTLFARGSVRLQRGSQFFQAEDGIRHRSPSRGLGDVYKRQKTIRIKPRQALV